MSSSSAPSRPHFLVHLGSLLLAVCAVHLAAPPASAQCVDYRDYARWVNRVPIDGNAWAIAIDGNYAYVGDWEGSGVLVLDISVPAGKRKTLPVETSRHAFAYIFEGSGTFRDASEPRAVKTDRVGAAETTQDMTGNRSLVLFDTGDEVTVQAGPDGIRFLLVSGKPLEEPVAWRGPIVMNTQEELRQAYSELSDGTFIKKR